MSDLIILASVSKLSAECQSLNHMDTITYHLVTFQLTKNNFCVQVKQEEILDSEKMTNVPQETASCLLLTNKAVLNNHCNYHIQMQI